MAGDRGSEQLRIGWTLPHIALGMAAKDYLLPFATDSLVEEFADWRINSLAYRAPIKILWVTLMSALGH
jgi:hypothetical protein